MTIENQINKRLQPVTDESKAYPVAWEKTSIQTVAVS